MLKHSLPEEPAAKVRVTPEELAAAISRIDVRQEASKCQTEGTVAIGEVVQELGIAATPTEILAEVQAGRRQNAGRQLTRFSANRRSGLILMTGILVMLLAAMQAGSFIAGHSPSNTTMASAASSGSTDDSQPGPILLDPNLRVKDATGKTVLISEVGDNQPVQCDFLGANPSFQPVGYGQYRWTLIKHEGKPYVRGKIIRMSPKVMQTDGAVVATSPLSPTYVVRVTLPLEGFKVDSNGNLNDQFHAVDIHLEKHAYEKWQP